MLINSSKFSSTGEIPDSSAICWSYREAQWWSCCIGDLGQWKDVWASCPHRIAYDCAAYAVLCWWAASFLTITSRSSQEVNLYTWLIRIPFLLKYLQVGLTRSMVLSCRLTAHTMYRSFMSRSVLRARSSLGTSHFWCLPGKSVLPWRLGTLLCSRLRNKLLCLPCIWLSCCMRLVFWLSHNYFVLFEQLLHFLETPSSYYIYLGNNGLWLIL